MVNEDQIIKMWHFIWHKNIETHNTATTFILFFSFMLIIVHNIKEISIYFIKVILVICWVTTGCAV